jgi:hypothetical protein
MQEWQQMDQKKRVFEFGMSALLIIYWLVAFFLQPHDSSLPGSGFRSASIPHQMTLSIAPVLIPDHGRCFGG